MWSRSVRVIVRLTTIGQRSRLVRAERPQNQPRTSTNPAWRLVAALLIALSVCRSTARALGLHVFMLAPRASRQSTGMAGSPGGSPTTITLSDQRRVALIACLIPGRTTLARVLDHFAVMSVTSGLRDFDCRSAHLYQAAQGGSFPPTHRPGTQR